MIEIWQYLIFIIYSFKIFLVLYVLKKFYLIFNYLKLFINIIDMLLNKESFYFYLLKIQNRVNVLFLIKVYCEFKLKIEVVVFRCLNEYRIEFECNC